MGTQKVITETWTEKLAVEELARMPECLAKVHAALAPSLSAYILDNSRLRATPTRPPPMQTALP